jgi:hypothetical protein
MNLVTTIGGIQRRTFFSFMALRMIANRVRSFATMTKKSVLAIGIDSVFADFSRLPDLTRAYIDTQTERLRALGYEVESCLIELGERAEQTVEFALRSRAFDCVVIGAGLREPPEGLQLFEKVINLVHRLASRSRIAFNTTPADTVEAARRWDE